MASTGTRTTPRNTLCVVVPTAMLLGIALYQHYLARTVQLTPWKGGGFGMFSTIDSGGNRRIEAEVESATGLRFRVAPRAYPGGLQVLRNLPSTSSLRDYGEWVSKDAWLPVFPRDAEYLQVLASLRRSVLDTSEDLSGMRYDGSGEARGEDLLRNEVQPLATDASGRPLAVCKPWSRRSAPPRVAVHCKRVTVRCYRARFDMEDGRVWRELLVEHSVAGTVSVEELAEQFGVPPDRVRWL